MKHIILCVFLSIGLYFYAYWRSDEEISSLKDVTNDIESIFYKLDLDNNNVLDLKEFLSMRNSFTILQTNWLENESSYVVQELPLLPISFGEQVVNIQVNFKPLDLHSLKKNISELSQSEKKFLQGVLEWKKPYKENHPFGATRFSSFLPPSTNVEPGFTWWIVESKPDKHFIPLSGRKYFPPKLQDENFLLLHALLCLFHPHPFIITRFNPQGTVAVVRAVDEHFLDVLFRVHAEFQLNQKPFYPFWFTPSQFQGRLIINKAGTIVKFFEMKVPDTKLNVDMEWYNGPTENNMEVDIGYVPQMSLISSAISVPGDKEMGAGRKLSSIKWHTEITVEEALKALELQMFPFKEVQYHTLDDAFRTASAESRLVHGIVLWGNLDDQSC